MLDGVLQFGFPRGEASPLEGGAATPLVVGVENRLLAPPLERLLNAANVEGADASGLPALFNPLVIVGPSGSGKSHLAQGLVRTWNERDGAEEVAYFTAADFGRERQAAEAEERLAAWRQQTRAVRLLVIEDVDRLRPRATIQQELRATIDAIIANGGTVLVTALREPVALPHLDPGLRDRLTAGLTIRLQRPNQPARRTILVNASTARGLALSPEQLDQLASKDCATPAHLLGRLASSVTSSGSLSSAERAGERGAVGASSPHLSPNPSPSRRGEQSDPSQHAQLKQILAVAARYFNVTQAALLGPSRRTSLVQARNVIVYLARQLTNLSYAEIGRALGGRDHTTIMHADRRLRERLGVDAATQQAVDELDRIVRS